MANNLVGVRDYLQGLGLDNNQIGWNQNTGMVQYGGKDLLKPTQLTDGRSFSSTSDILNALKSNNIPYAGSPTSYNTSIQGLLSKMSQNLNQPFEYDVYSDPAYQSAQAAAKRNAKTATRSAEEEMNARGILNSTVTSDRLGQIQQEAQQSVTDLIPSLMQNAYNREQAKNSNLMNLLGIYTNLESNSYNRDLAERQFQAELQKNEDYMSLQTQQLELQRKQQDIYNAVTRINTLGYADNDTAKILGIPVGTPSAQARQAAEEMRNRMKLASIEAGNRIAAIEKEYALRAAEQEAANKQRLTEQALETTRFNIEEEKALRKAAAEKAFDELGNFDQERFNQIYNALKYGNFTAPSTTNATKKQEDLTDLFNE